LLVVVNQNLEHSQKALGIIHTESKRWPILGAIYGPIFFALAYTILGFIRPGFSQISEPISGLGVGANAPAMNLSFILTGVLMFIGVVWIFRNIREIGAIARRSCMLMLVLSPIGCIICGLYNYESSLHFIGFFLACGIPIVCFPAVGFILRRVPHYRRIGNSLILGGPLTLVLMYWFMATFDYLNTDVGIAGLTERILVLEVHAFYVVLGWIVFFKKSR
jgi:hypothetical membrane protein